MGTGVTRFRLADTFTDSFARLACGCRTRTAQFTTQAVVMSETAPKRTCMAPSIVRQGRD